MELQDRYTLGELEMLNRGKVRLPADLSRIFDTYRMPANCLVHPYGNAKNVRFAQAAADAGGYKNGKLGAMAERVKKTMSSSDDKIMLELRKAFSSVVTGENGTLQCVNAINQLMVAPKMVPRIAELFFTTMVQNPTLVTQYVSVLFTLNRHDGLQGKLQLEFCKYVLNVFDNPPTLQDSKIASGEDLTVQHRSVTCAVVTALFSYNFSSNAALNLSGPRKTFDSFSKLQDRFLNPIFSQLLAEDATERMCVSMQAAMLKTLSNALGRLAASKKFPELKATFIGKVKQLFADKRFKLTHRMALRELANA